MTRERGQRVYAAFETALNCDDAGRAALIQELSGDDPQTGRRSRATPRPGRGGGAGSLSGDPGADGTGRRATRPVE